MGTESGLIAIRDCCEYFVSFYDPTVLMIHRTYFYYYYFIKSYQMRAQFPYPRHAIPQKS